jgi:hypothetical protein
MAVSSLLAVVVLFSWAWEIVAQRGIGAWFSVVQFAGGLVVAVDLLRWRGQNRQLCWRLVVRFIGAICIGGSVLVGAVLNGGRAADIGPDGICLALFATGLVAWLLGGIGRAVRDVLPVAASFTIVFGAGAGIVRAEQAGDGVPGVIRQGPDGRWNSIQGPWTGAVSAVSSSDHGLAVVAGGELYIEYPTWHHAEEMVDARPVVGWLPDGSAVVIVVPNGGLDMVLEVDPVSGLVRGDIADVRLAVSVLNIAADDRIALAGKQGGVSVVMVIDGHGTLGVEEVWSGPQDVSGLAWEADGQGILLSWRDGVFVLGAVGNDWTLVGPVAEGQFPVVEQGGALVTVKTSFVGVQAFREEHALTPDTWRLRSGVSNGVGLAVAGVSATVVGISAGVTDAALGVLSVWLIGLVVRALRERRGGWYRMLKVEPL